MQLLKAQIESCTLVSILLRSQWNQIYTMSLSHPLPLALSREELQFRDISHDYTQLEGDYQKFLLECGMGNSAGLEVYLSRDLSILFFYVIKCTLLHCRKRILMFNYKK